MKISQIKKGAIGTVQKSGSAGAAKSVKGAGNEASAVKKAGVMLSTNEDISSVFSQNATKRSDKVASLKMEVVSGNYRTDSEKTAAGIMKDVTGYSLA